MPRTRYHRQPESIPFSDLPAAALRACLREGYGMAAFRSDLLGGIVVGIVALPLSMALAIAVGVPPQHGLYTAIVAGIVVPLLGGSRLQVTGPTAAFVVILAPIYTRFGLGGLLTAGFIAGVMLIGFAIARFGKLLQFIPHPVTTGFTAGIGVVIGTLQLKDFLGLHVEKMPEHYLSRVWALGAAMPTIDLPTLLVGAFALAVLLLFPRVTTKMPAPLVSVVAATLLAVGLHAFLGDRFTVETIGSRFTLSGAPPLPHFPWNWSDGTGASLSLWTADGAHVNFSAMQALFRAGLAIAMLGAIESLLSAVVADGMAGTRHDPDAELFGLGVGNVLTPFFGGIPATGAIARTATNFRAGGRTPLACVIHAVFLLAAMLALSPLLRFIPMAALAALLLLVAWRMAEAKHFVHIARVAPKSDVAVLFTCFLLTVVFDMVIGVTVGVMLAAVLFMRRMSEVTSATLVSDAKGHPELGELPAGVVVYAIAGPLFFGAAEKAMRQLQIVARGTTRVVVLELSGVPAMDATGLVALESTLRSIRAAGAIAILSGVHAQPERALHKAHIEEEAGALAYRPDIESSLALAKSLVSALPAPAPPQASSVRSRA